MTPPSAASPSQLIGAWRRILSGEPKSWVLFRQGTSVLLKQPEADLRAQAIELMREWGPVDPGSPAGDFSILRLSDGPGWIVTCHHPDILTFVAPEEIPAERRENLTIGLLGRRKRDQDSSALEVIHVEDQRGSL